MTVAELRECLAGLPQDAEVSVTWEGTVHWLEPDNVYVSADGFVLLDGYGNTYKEGFMTNGLRP